MVHAPTMELFSYWRTSATYRVRVAFNLKNIQANERFINVDAGEHQSPEYLKINPMGAIPALILSGKAPLTQSLAILEFLEEWQPQPPLLPADIFERARVRSIAQMLAVDIHPLITPRIKKHLMNVNGFDDAMWKDWQSKWFTTGLSALEQRLASESSTGRFCHGDSPTIADICLMSIVVVMRIFKITVPDIPTIDRIVMACEQLDAFVRAEPMRQVGAPSQ
jgi:maleylacetoacetate isomerase